MNPDDIAQLITILVGIGGTLSPIVFWIIETLVKPFIKDNRFLPYCAIGIGAVLGAALPFILPSFGMTAVPLIGSIVAGVAGGAIAMKTYDKGVTKGIEKTKE